MAICRAVSVTAFSRELRRRMGQSRRTGREFVPPGAKRPRPRGSCCLILLLLIIALIVYAYLEGYVLRPRGGRTTRAAEIVLPNPEMFRAFATSLPHVLESDRLWGLLPQASIRMGKRNWLR